MASQRGIETRKKTALGGLLKVRPRRAKADDSRQKMAQDSDEREPFR
jgi:hypothetical protein